MMGKYKYDSVYKEYKTFALWGWKNQTTGYITWTKAIYLYCLTNQFKGDI